MADPPTLGADLAADLRDYFAATTSTVLPRAVTTMSAHSLTRDRGRRRPTALASAFGLIAAVALLLVLTTHLGPQGAGNSASLSAGSGAGSVAAPAYRPAGPSALGYPGLSVTSLGRSGVVLLPSGGHGTPAVTAPRAMAEAAAVVGPAAGTPGPAVLAFAELSARSITCLCWVVVVPVGGPAVPSAAGVAARKELVLVDAGDGHIVAAVPADGTP